MGSWRISGAWGWYPLSRVVGGGGSGGAGGWLGGWGVHGMAGNASRRHCLLVGAAAVGGSLIGAVGAMGPFWPGVGPFSGRGGLVGCVQSRELGARAFRG